MIVLNNLMPEHKALLAGQARTSLVRIAFFELVLDAAPLQIVLIFVVLGLFPDREAALYITAVVLLLLRAAFFLLNRVRASGGSALARQARGA